MYLVYVDLYLYYGRAEVIADTDIVPNILIM